MAPALDGPGLDELVTPDAPGSVTVANVDGLGGGNDTGKVIVSWSAAGDNGSAITKYTVRYGVDPRVGCVTAALKCVVSGLTPGASLPFNVIASNGVGDGPASADVLATPLTKPRALRTRRRSPATRVRSCPGRHRPPTVVLRPRDMRSASSTVEARGT